MQIKVFTSALELEGIIDNFDTFIWVSRYWHVGEFKIYAPATEYNLTTLKVGYVVMKQDDENNFAIDGAVWHRAGTTDYAKQQAEARRNFEALAAHL